MKSRLAFSIACLVNPDILILDEVLSVGDGVFRVEKPEEDDGNFESGVTTLFVSQQSLEEVRRFVQQSAVAGKGETDRFRRLRRNL